MDSTENNTDYIETEDINLTNQGIHKNEMQHEKNNHISNRQSIFNEQVEALAVNFFISKSNCSVINSSQENATKFVIPDDEYLHTDHSSQEINTSNCSDSVDSPISIIRSVENSKNEIKKYENKYNMSDLSSKLTESSSALSSSSSYVNSSGIGSNDLSPNYDLSRSPSSETFQNHQSQMIRKRDGSVASQGSVTSSSSNKKFTETKDELGFLLVGTAPSKKSRNDVIPQRKRRDFIPAELKDESYWERRRKNNLAAKRSREKRRLNDIVLETKVLELTNINNLMKLKFDLCIKKYNIHEDDIEKLFEENKHLLVIQESLDMSDLLTNEDSLTPGFDNDYEDKNFSSTSSYLSSSSSTTSGKRKSFKDDSLNDGLLISSIESSTHHHMTHSSSQSSKMVSDNSCSISTNSSHHIDSNSSRRSNSSVDDADCDGFNDAISENGLEIDENLDTIIETNDNVENKNETDEIKTKISHDFLELISNDDLNDEEEEENCSPPSKRKSFFNPKHTSSCPSKSPSPTLQQQQEEQMNNATLSPIDLYSLKRQSCSKVTKTASDKLLQLNETKFKSDEMAFVDCIRATTHKEIKTEPTQMKNQYPLLYNQLCKSSSGSNNDNAKKTQPKQLPEITPSAVYTLEKQNQILLNHIINNNDSGLTANNDPFMKSILNEISLRNEVTKQRSSLLTSLSSNTNPNISISTLLKQSETNSTGKTDILTKILTSSISCPINSQTNPSSNVLLEQLGSLLKASSPSLKKDPPMSVNNHANVLMEKYKNLINKTNINTQQTNQHKLNHQYLQEKNCQSSNHSNKSSTFSGQQRTINSNEKSFATLLPSSSKNTVNSLLQSFQTVQLIQPDQNSSKPKNQLSSSRKRHLNQLEKNEQTSDDVNPLLTSNPELLALVKQQKQQQHHQSENLNEFVTMLLSNQQNTHNFKNSNGRQLATSIRDNMQVNITNSKNSNSAKNQTYNQLLIMHQTQKLHQQQQRQNELNRSSQTQVHDSTNLTSQNSPDQLQQLHAKQFYYQQRAKLNMINAEIKNQNNNNSGGDNMPLKLRFKMLQLKTEKVN